MKKRTVTDMDYDEFDALCIEKLGLMRDFTIIAAEEWGNDEEHSFDVPSTYIYRKDMDELYIAAKEYQTALALNAGIDPYIGWDKKDDAPLVKEARSRLIKATNYGLHVLAECLYEKGALEAGDYLISVSW